jgi:FHA domain
MAIIRAPITSLCFAISGVEIGVGLGEHMVGRGADCSICIEDPLASRRHAVITVTPESASIRDLGSRNGVLVNGDEIDGERVLATGDLVTLGSQAMTVVQIRRDNRPSKPPRDGPGPRTNPTLPIARVALLSTKGAQVAQVGEERPRTLPPIPVLVVAPPSDDELGAQGRAATTRGGSAAFYRPVGAFRLIVEAARRAVAAGQPARAEKILEVPLNEVLRALSAGKLVDPQILDDAASEATMLCELTHRTHWVAYVRELFEQQKLPVPPALAARLHAAMR